MLDSANYDTATVTIGKSVTLLAVPGTLGSVLGVNGQDALNVTSGKVTLRNLVVVGTRNANQRGILLNGGDLRVEQCTITNVGVGILALGGNAHITDTVICDTQNGFDAAGPVIGVLDNVRLKAAAFSATGDVFAFYGDLGNEVIWTRNNNTLGFYGREITPGHSLTTLGVY